MGPVTRLGRLSKHVVGLIRRPLGPNKALAKSTTAWIVVKTACHFVKITSLSPAHKLQLVKK